MWRHVVTLLALAVGLGACDRRIYVVDGVTDGDTFYLAEYAYFDDDPALQAWMAYSLDLAACQLLIGGPNPARNSSFACELSARESLVDEWRDQVANDGTAEDPYLDALLDVEEADWLPEYVAVELGRRGWVVPEDLKIDGYRDWREGNLTGHRVERRLIGSWNFRDEVTASVE
ncbi:MAG: hypothetical protein AAGC71_16890 [Pseudomonadota bacterium]